MISASSMALATHTPFQVSTSGVLVEGLFSGVVSSATLFQHGDFDLRTFADLDRNGTRDSRAPQGEPRAHGLDRRDLRQVRVQEEAKYGRKSGVERPLYVTVQYAAAIGATGLMIRTADEIAPVFQEGI